MGERMSCWYFEGGGLLMSSAARDSYFKLVRALTKAAGAKDLAVPTFPRDMQDVSLEKVHMSRKKLAVLNLDNIEEWTFGSASVSRDQSKVELHLQFKDYIFLQKLASQLRTELSFDLRSRRRPA
jgi:hypothetical protein